MEHYIDFIGLLACGILLLIAIKLMGKEQARIDKESDSDWIDIK